MKEKSIPTKPKKKISRLWFRKTLYFVTGIVGGMILLLLFFGYKYESTYENRAYPGISVGDVDVSGKTHSEITKFWLSKNISFDALQFTFAYENHIATISGSSLDIGFDATLSATQALSIGRTSSILTNLQHKYTAWQEGINLSPLFKWQEEELEKVLEILAQEINIEPENALFEFQNGRVTLFKPAKSGRVLDTEQTKRQFREQLSTIATQNPANNSIVFSLPVFPKEPLLKTEDANNFGIKELVGQGESFFKGSIAGRIHNLTLGASRINGVLIPPGETFFFNKSVGDISAATGYKQAYIIKSGRTVLDDGGGICQVSTTLFRAVLNSGLPIIERHAHSYRVGYYEQGRWKPGFDATVFAPSYDFKFKNDTANFVLIQSRVEPAQSKLTFELYGVKDGRNVEISPVRLWDSRPAPPDLYQDDPTLPSGTVKQVDWANPGIKAAFDYKVTKNKETLFETTFFSNFIPWQAVYLRGTKTN